MLRVATIYYYGGVIGGWGIFFLAAVGIALWIWYDSLQKDLNVWGWRIGSLLISLFLFPSLLFRFTVPPGNPNSIPADQFGKSYITTCLTGPNFICPNTTQDTPALLPFWEEILYLGLLGGIIAVIIGIIYYQKFQFVEEDEEIWTPPPPIQNYGRYPVQGSVQPPPSSSGMGYVPVKPSKPNAPAWLVARDGKTYQLKAGETIIGRSSSNDIYLTGDTTISKQHAKIVQQNNYFRLIDLGSRNGTRVNGRWVRQPILLSSDDEIKFGDRYTMRFVTTRK
jgi:hypothetical protein